jgi:hypothetical protein
MFDSGGPFPYPSGCSDAGLARLGGGVVGLAVARIMAAWRAWIWCMGMPHGAALPCCGGAVLLAVASRQPRSLASRGYEVGGGREASATMAVGRGGPPSAPRWCLCGGGLQIRVRPRHSGPRRAPWRLLDDVLLSATTGFQIPWRLVVPDGTVDLDVPRRRMHGARWCGGFGQWTTTL